MKSDIQIQWGVLIASAQQVAGPPGGWKAWRVKVRRLHQYDIDTDWEALVPQKKRMDGEDENASQRRKVRVPSSDIILIFYPIDFLNLVVGEDNRRLPSNDFHIYPSRSLLCCVSSC